MLIWMNSLFSIHSFGVPSCIFFLINIKTFVYKYILFVWLCLVSFLFVPIHSPSLYWRIFFGFVNVFSFHSCHSTCICAVVVDWIQITKNKKGCYCCLHYWYYWMNNFMLYNSVWIPNAGIVNELYWKSPKRIQCVRNGCICAHICICHGIKWEREREKKVQSLIRFFCIL